MTFRAPSGFSVNEADAFALETLELGGDIVDAIGDVMQARTSTLEEATDGGVGSEGLEELDGADEGDTDSLGLEDLWWGTAFAGEEFVEGASLFDGGHGDGHVVEGSIRRRREHHHEWTCA